MTTAIPGAQALLDQLDRQPQRIVRLIATIKPGAASLAQTQQALRTAGAHAGEPLGETLLVMEVHAAQLRAVLAAAPILRVQVDGAVPTN